MFRFLKNNIIPTLNINHKNKMGVNKIYKNETMIKIENYKIH